jgi:molybdopterin/thiamine biosynthesis adenylyltransferase
LANYAIIGAGGIGTYLLEPLIRFLAYSKKAEADPDVLYVVDGDIVEVKNMARQHTLASVGQNKAEVLCSRARGIVGDDLTMRAIPHYYSLEKQNLPCHKEWLTNGITVFVCVDNDKTRVLIEKALCKLDDATMVVGGNSFDKGQAQLFVRRDKKNVTPRISELAPEILEEDAEDLFPDDLDCLEAAVSSPQLVFANSAVANAMHGLWYAMTLNATPETSVNEIQVNVGLASARQARRTLTPALKLT